MIDKSCIEYINIFKELEEAEKKEVLSHFKEESFQKHETIYTPYEDFEKIFMLKSGEVLLYQIAPDGKKVIIEVLKEGNVFLNFSLYLEPPVKLSDFAEAAIDTEVCSMVKDEFVKVLIKYPKVALRVIKELGRKLNEADSRIRDLAITNSNTRAINELLRLSSKFGEQTGENKIKLTVKITHEEFSELIGVSRETATKILNHLEKKSFISYSEDKFIIVNIEKIGEPM